MEIIQLLSQSYNSVGVFTFVIIAFYLVWVLWRDNKELQKNIEKKDQIILELAKGSIEAQTKTTVALEHNTEALKQNKDAYDKSMEFQRIFVNRVEDVLRFGNNGRANN